VRDRIAKPRDAPAPKAPQRALRKPQPGLGVSNALVARSLERRNTDAPRAARTAFLGRVWTGTEYVNYGPVNSDGTATSMHAELHTAKAGSRPTVKPTWWPAAPQGTKDWFESYMVQGHLLNDNLGGPGNTLSNLTPLTRTANTRHHWSAEWYIKNRMAKGGVHAEYQVTVKHGAGVTAKGIGITDPTVAADVNTNYASKIPDHIEADVTYYDTTGKWLTGEGWIVQNEMV
jgi:hypothetical protein